MFAENSAEPARWQASIDDLVRVVHAWDRRCTWDRRPVETHLGSRLHLQLFTPVDRFERICPEVPRLETLFDLPGLEGMIQPEGTVASKALQLPSSRVSIWSMVRGAPSLHVFERPLAFGDLQKLAADEWDRVAASSQRMLYSVVEHNDCADRGWPFAIVRMVGGRERLYYPGDFLSAPPRRT